MRLAKPLNYSAKSPDRQCHKGEILAARADPGGLMQLPISNRQIAVALELQHVAPLAVHLDGAGGAANTVKPLRSRTRTEAAFSGLHAASTRHNSSAPKACSSASATAREA